jgi:cation:H+ antiporter
MHHLMFDYLLLVGGLILLFVGGEGTLRGALHLSKNFKISKFFVSAIIIGFGTSLSELTVSIGAVLQGKTDLALGNIIGSNTANILFVFALAILISPMATKVMKNKRDLKVLIIVTLVFMLFKILDFLNFLTGILFVVLLFTYIFISYRLDKREQKKVAHLQEDHGIKKALPVSVSFLICFGGLAALISGSNMLILAANVIALRFGISEGTIGLTIVAVGTGLPELTACIIASLKRHYDMVIGNIIGSNIFNILGILGGTLLFGNIPVSDELMQSGIIIMLFATMIFSALFYAAAKIHRFLGFFLLSTYLGYLVFLFQ